MIGQRKPITPSKSAIEKCAEAELRQLDQAMQGPRQDALEDDKERGLQPTRGSRTDIDDDADLLSAFTSAGDALSLYEYQNAEEERYHNRAETRSNPVSPSWPVTLPSATARPSKSAPAPPVTEPTQVVLDHVPVPVPTPAPVPTSPPLASPTPVHTPVSAPEPLPALVRLATPPTPDSAPALPAELNDETAADAQHDTDFCGSTASESDSSETASEPENAQEEVVDLQRVLVSTPEEAIAAAESFAAELAEMEARNDVTRQATRAVRQVARTASPEPIDTTWSRPWLNDNLPKPRQRPASAPAPKKRPLPTELGPFNVMLFGNPSVGKTAMVARYCGGDAATIAARMAPTTIADMTTKRVELEDLGTWVTLNIWDTAGDPRFDKFLPKYIRSLDAAVLVYAVDDPNSVKSLAVWHDKIVKQGAPKCAVWFSVANKIDIDGGRPQYDPQSRYARTIVNGMEVSRICDISNSMCASALSGEGVADLFRSVSRELVNRHIKLNASRVEYISRSTSGEKMQAAATSMNTIELRNIVAYRQSAEVEEGEDEEYNRIALASLPYRMLTEHEIRYIVRAQIRGHGIYSFCTIS